MRSSTSNIGATKAHKLQASLQGGYENVGPEVIDYKIFRMKMGNIIGDKDAQLVVDKMNMRKDELPNYLSINVFIVCKTQCFGWMKLISYITRSLEM